MGLSARFDSADSAAIEDIPSSMQPQGTHHERHPASPLQLQHLSRNGLHLRLPACRRTNRLCLQPTVPVRRRLQLRPFLSRFAAGTAQAAGLPPAPMH